MVTALFSSDGYHGVVDGVMIWVVGVFKGPNSIIVGLLRKTGHSSMTCPTSLQALSLADDLLMPTNFQFKY